MTDTSVSDVSADPSPASTEASVAAPSESTTGNQGVGSYLDAVNSALGDKPETPPVSKEPGQADPDPSDTPGEPPKDPFELSEQEKQQFTAGVQRRIRELAEVNRTTKAELEPLRQEIETLKPQAERFERLDGFMREHEIAPDHLNSALGLTAMINSGDDRVIPILENLLEQVRGRAGEILPDDLRQRVNLGYITEADAKALHKARTSEQRARAEADKVRQTTEAKERATATDAMVAGAAKAADEWSAEQAKSDPDWNLKRDLVTQAAELRLHRAGPEGYPRDKQALRELLVEAKKDVEKRIRTFGPRPKQIDPPPTGNGASPRATAKPKSYLEALEQGLASSTRG